MNPSPVPNPFQGPFPPGSAGVPFPRDVGAFRSPQSPPEIVHQLTSGPIVLHITQRAEQVTGFKFSVTFPAMKPVTFAIGEPLPVALMKKLNQILTEQILTECSNGAHCPDVAVKALVRALEVLPGGMWEIRSAISEAHASLTDPEKAGIFPHPLEVLGSPDCLRGVFTAEKVSQHGSTAVAARIFPQLGIICVQISEVSPRDKDPHRRAFEIRTPCLIDTTYDEVSAWQMARISGLFSAFEKIGPSALLELLSSLDDTVETTPSKAEEKLINTRLLNWQLDPNRPERDLENDGGSITWEIGTAAAVMKVGYPEHAGIPDIVLRFVPARPMDRFSATQIHFIESIGQLLASNDEESRQSAIDCLNNPLLFLDGDGLAPEPPDERYLAQVQLRALSVELSGELPQPFGEDFTNRLVCMENLDLQVEPPTSSIFQRLDGIARFSVALNPDVRGCHHPDFFQSASFALCPDGSFDVILENRIGGFSRAHIESSLADRDDPLINILQAISEQPTFGWLAVHKMIHSLAGESLALLEWDPAYVRLSNLPLTDETAAASYSQAARLASALTVGVPEKSRSVTLEDAGRGRYTLQITRSHLPAVRVTIFNDGIEGVSFLDHTDNTDERDGRPVIALRAPKGITIGSYEGHSVVVAVGKYLENIKLNRPKNLDAAKYLGQLSSVATLQRIFSGNTEG